MNRLIASITFVLMFCIRTYAQTGLNIDPYFSENNSGREGVSLIILDGKLLGVSNLSVFKSVTANSNNAWADKLKTAVMADGRKAASRQVKLKNGKTYYAFYSLDPPGNGQKKRRYIMMVDKRLTGGTDVLAIYLEGKISEKDIQQLININK